MAVKPAGWGLRHHRWASTSAGQERVVELVAETVPLPVGRETDSWWSVVPWSTSIRPLMSPYWSLTKGDVFDLPGHDWSEDHVRHEASVRREAVETEGGISPARRVVAAAGRS
jgi:hypothetical protein